MFASKTVSPAPAAVAEMPANPLFFSPACFILSASKTAPAAELATLYLPAESASGAQPVTQE